MTALREVVDSNKLANIFDLPPDLKNKKLEILIFPVEESGKKSSLPSFSSEQINEWANAPDIKMLVGALDEKKFPVNVTMNDIRNERLAEKYLT